MSSNELPAQEINDVGLGPRLRRAYCMLLVVVGTAQVFMNFATFTPAISQMTTSTAKSTTIVYDMKQVIGNGTLDSEPTSSSSSSSSSSSTSASGFSYDTVKPLKKYNSYLRFVFVIGLEGTGHHFMGAIIRASPVREYFSQIGVWPDVSRVLGHSLYNHNSPDGLWNSHCKHALYGGQKNNRKDKKKDKNKKVRRRLSKLDKGPDTNELLNNVAKQLAGIEQMARDNPSNLTAPITMAVNTWLGAKQMGMVSYPNFSGDCRKLNYPNLDVFYGACDVAKVDCQHVYIHRDPYAVLNSAGRRGYYENTLGGIHLYTSHLNVIMAQLVSHPQRIAGCFDLFKFNATYEKDWFRLAALYGWQSKEDFEKQFGKVYRAPETESILSKKEKLRIVPQKFAPFLNSMYEVHNKVIAICNQLVEQNEERERTKANGGGGGGGDGSSGDSAEGMVN